MIKFLRFGLLFSLISACFAAAESSKGPLETFGDAQREKESMQLSADDISASHSYIDRWPGRSGILQVRLGCLSTVPLLLKPAVAMASSPNAVTFTSP